MKLSLISCLLSQGRCASRSIWCCHVDVVFLVVYRELPGWDRAELQEDKMMGDGEQTFHRWVSYRYLSLVIMALSDWKRQARSWWRKVILILHVESGVQVFHNAFLWGYNKLAIINAFSIQDQDGS